MQSLIDITSPPLVYRNIIPCKNKEKEQQIIATQKYDHNILEAS